MPTSGLSGLVDFPPRRYTARPLPVYRHNPGQTPHPIVDEAGHSHEREEAAPAFAISAAGEIAVSAEARACQWQGLGWQRCDPYLYGVDLFNHAFFWEAHESWEPLWHAAGHRSAPGFFVQGLIQVAAVMLLVRCQRPNAVPRMLERAERNLYRAVEASPEAAEHWAYGIDLARWLPRVAATLGGKSQLFPFIELQLT